MKVLSIAVVLLCLMSCASVKETTKSIDQIVETSCGICQLSMAGDECQLAIVVDGKNYYVEGSVIDDHGNAHSEHGLCNEVRHAKVKGEFKQGIYVVTFLELIPLVE